MKNVGVLGAGQLGRMLALAGFPLGFRFCFLDPTANSPASEFAPQIVAPFEPGPGLDELVSRSDVLTFEFENVPVSMVEPLVGKIPVYPPPKALSPSQDRLLEKQLFRKLGMETVAFRAVDSMESCLQAVQELGLPLVLKTRRLGYDGKGQKRAHSLEEAKAAFLSLASSPLIAEAFLPFDRELSLVAVRGQKGDCEFYPLVENHHNQGILHLTLAPAPNLDPRLDLLAREQVEALMRDLDYVGVLAVEFFEKDGKLIASEMAPRVHNSGHWSIEGAQTSQFENHIRAITGLPLGSTCMAGPCAMVNLIGSLPAIPKILEISGASFHDYSKEGKPGRKIGHVTLRGPDWRAVKAALKQCHGLLPEGVRQLPFLA